MKRFAFILLFCVIQFPALSQKLKLRPSHQLTDVENKSDEINHQCEHRDRYSIAQRLKFYPFNNAVKVQLVAFGSSNEHYRTAAEHKLIYWKYPFSNNNQIDTTQFIEVKSLNATQINKLTDIFYNIGERATNTASIPMMACYDPHNAIIFINGKGKIFAYLEICFECENIRLFPKKFKLAQFCHDKYSLIKSYFASIGIVYGVNNSYTLKFNRIKRS